MTDLTVLRDAVRAAHYPPEGEVVQALAAEARGHLSCAQRRSMTERARLLVDGCRRRSDLSGSLEAFLQEFGLGNREGVALMCLAESLLRVPDEATADRLIAENIRTGDWKAHVGRSQSALVNASVWGLMLTGQVVSPPAVAETDAGTWLKRLVSRIGEPVVRAAILQAMRILGRQFVLGRTIDEAIRRSYSDRGRAERYSFDMLGESARTAADARRHHASYLQGIRTLGTKAGECGGGGDGCADSVSVKLSALHPRYEFAQRDRMLDELVGSLSRPRAGKPGAMGSGSVSTQRRGGGLNPRWTCSSRWRLTRTCKAGMDSVSCCRPTRSEPGR